MSVEQMSLERKLAELRQQEAAEKAAKEEAARRDQERRKAIRRTQVTVVSNMLAAALKELEILKAKPSGKHDELVKVAQRHAERVLAVAVDGEPL